MVITQSLLPVAYHLHTKERQGNQGPSRGATAIFIMVVSLAVLAHDVSACAGDVLIGITIFPIGWIFSQQFEKLGDGCNELCQCSIRVQPIRERVRSLKHMKLCINT